MKKIFKYDTCENAFNALIESLEHDFEWDSIDEVGFWLEEFIRDSIYDEDWLNTVINTIGSDYWAIKNWFLIQETKEELWTDESYSLIELWVTVFEEN